MVLRERDRGGAPVRITAESGPWPLHGAAAAKALEAQVLQRHAPGELMERAGLAVARLARAVASAAAWVEVWCGPGNNGGDGYVAARRLHEAGTRVRVCECGEPERLPADAREARARALAAGVPMAPSPPATGQAQASPGLVIDALLGLGTSRAPAGRIADAIGRMHARRAAVLAVDLPSGLDPDTGQPFGSTVVRADHTLSLLSLKPGLFTAHGRDLAGTVWFDDLGERSEAGPGEAAGAAGPTAYLAGPVRRAAQPHASHKGRRGDVWVVGGADGMTGAASLAARAALVAGAGRVYLSRLGSRSAPDFDPVRPELMLRSYADASTSLLATSTVVAGCGGGEAIRECLPALLAKAPRLVLDADALNLIATAPELQRLLDGRAGRGQASVLTPHPLEAARLLGCESAAVQADRLAAAGTLATRHAAVVVLKGSGTIVAVPGELPRINPSGNAALATAGTGDVLAGWLGGLLAQAPPGAVFETACAAVWQHGRAADLERPAAAASAAPLLASDLIDVLGRSC